MAPSSISLRPATERAAARNHDSNSDFASTTLFLISGRAFTARRKLNRLLQFAGFNDPLARHPDGAGQVQREIRAQSMADPPEQDRDCLNLSLPFDYRRDPEHRSGHGPEKVELIRIQSREIRVWIKLVHAQELPGCVKVIAEY